MTRYTLAAAKFLAASRASREVGRMGIVLTVKEERDWVYNPRSREYERVK